ncbi:hypothetical protein VNO77_28123 [Canavalia gladiata]|uniref:Uncharacterized protein n=1 Tax=Canavalia gladiata TaxID=3824 RepID=A0AAN9Q4N6_CANGL
MALLRTLLSRRLPSLLLNPHSLKTPHRPASSLPQYSLGPNSETRPTKKPLHALFAEAVGLSEKPATSDDEDEDEDEDEAESDTELKRNLKQLEQEVREKTKTIPKKAEKRSLVAVFTNQPRAATVTKQNEPKPVVAKDLSTDAVMFVQYLYEKGYFRDANFLKKGKQSFNIAWFESFFARGYINFAAQRFAKDNQDIAKWLSGSALKQVAVFGCPSIDRSSAIPAKILRKYFEVPENTVCSECTLQQSCKFVNQSVWNCNTNNLDLTVVMKVITKYALESVHPQLVVPDKINKSVSHLLKEVVKLSQTT